MLVTHHRLQLLELLEVEVGALAARGERSTRRTSEALKAALSMALSMALSIALSMHAEARREAL